MTLTKPRLFALSGAFGALLVALAMWSQATLGAQLLPHSFCITASPALLWLHVVSDGLIAAAYLMIPWTMLSFVRKRRDIPLGWVAWLFGAFIVACGMTHIMDVWTLWDPVYWYSGVMKAFTALASVGTAWMLYRLTPVALAIPSAQQLRQANASLQQEIRARMAVEVELARAKEEVEMHLREATARSLQDSAVIERFFEVAPLGLALLDEDLRYARVNPALEDMNGGQPGTRLGLRFDEAPGVAPHAVEAVRSVAATRRLQRGIEVSCRDDGGVPRHWVSSYFPIDVPGGAVLVGCIMEDVTAKREVEQRLERALADAERANRAKDEFLAKVSHELRTPLQIAMSSSEVLRRIPDMPAQAQKFVARLSSSVASQSRMISDLLDFSRILSGKLHLEPQLIDPAAPLLQIMEHWRAVAGNRAIRIETHGLDQFPRPSVVADPVRLEQVYSNLIDNAIRFSREGGRITVASASGPQGWRLTVRDEGVGITPQEQAHIFEPFAQGSARSNAEKGLGLGLSIVRSIVQASGGSVSAASNQPESGATFTVDLPAAPPHSAAAAGPTLPDGDLPLRIDGLRILYVEDEADVAVPMQLSLAAMGAHVETAASYDAALAKLDGATVDVLVTDMNLGQGPSGMEVGLMLRQMPRHSAVPVIVVSAFGSAEDIAATRRAGFADHLVKPVDARTVASAVLRALKRTPATG